MRSGFQPSPGFLQRKRLLRRLSLACVFLSMLASPLPARNALEEERRVAAGLRADERHWRRARELFPDVRHEGRTPAEGAQPSLVAPVAVSKVFPGAITIKSPGGQRETIDGFVAFAVVVGPDGVVRAAEPLETRNRLVMHRGREALLQWRFRPGTVGGVKAPFVVLVPLRFGGES